MDIFTTQLTRVVPVPIKPANLKVKALLKEAGTGKLKEDLDHLENHDYYFQDEFKAKPKEQSGDEQSDDENKEQAEHHEAEQTAGTSLDSSETQSPSSDETNSGVTESTDGRKHLDLYV